MIKKVGLTKELLEERILSEFKKLTSLEKKPSSILVLEEDEVLKDRDNKYLPEGNEKHRLLDFIKNLKANNIQESQVKTIDVRNIKEIKEDLNEEYKRHLREQGSDDCCCIQ